MALRIRCSTSPGMTLNYSIERLFDGTFFDFATTGTTAQTFTATPTTMLSSLPASNGASSIYPSGDQANLNGDYAYTLPTASMPAAQFTNGSYCVRIHNANSSNQVIDDMNVILFSQDDEPVFPAGSTDPWATDVPGTYASGTAGYKLGNLAAGSGPTAAEIATQVWTDITSSDFTVAGSPGYNLTNNLNASISSRLAASSYVQGPTAAEIATQLWTDTTSTDFTVAGSPGYNLNHAPSWYTTPPIPPTAAQIATQVLTDTNASDLDVTGSLGAVTSIFTTQPTWYTSGGGGGGGSSQPFTSALHAGAVGNLVGAQTVLNGGANIGGLVIGGGGNPLVLANEVLGAITTGSTVQSPGGVMMSAYALSTVASSTVLAASVVSGATSLTLSSTTGITAGMVLGLQQASVGETVTVQAVSGTTVTVTATQFGYAGGSNVYPLAASAYASVRLGSTDVAPSTSYGNVLFTPPQDYWISFSNLDTVNAVTVTATFNAWING